MTAWLDGLSDSTSFVFGPSRKHTLRAACTERREHSNLHLGSSSLDEDPLYPWAGLTIPGINIANEERALRLANHLSDRHSAKSIKQVYIDKRFTKR
jgi:hypothetical protein